ncbi:MAG TPA: 4-(cytidine 5'-diphospho)-2-C-methyl-D-erythritol kinase [Pyrinomonadaceae bacterium]|nr:4-(cytidine 5'-diphospho)-2-C-methyl-D-erythritol kinase [Pyrinomonadaceae bacterium]
MLDAMRFSLPSFAKINWTLRVLGKRSDGYHELFTVFQTISLRDRIEFEDAGTLSLTCSDLRIPTTGDNLILRAAEMLGAATGVKKGARIHLEKQIPSPGGLGGGSSNAAVALIGLSRLWEVDTLRILPHIAAGLGSDVPFFLCGGTAIGTGRGEIIEAIEDIPSDSLLIVTPEAAVPTAHIFARFRAETLTRTARNHTLSVCRAEAEMLEPVASELVNDLEGVVFEAFPEVARVKTALLELGAVNAVLCGSGASVLGVFDKQETRQTAKKALDSESTWRKFAVSAVSRSRYREELGLLG